ncbi:MULTISPECIES: type I-G CRISPR-associated protein Cas8g1/Csx17 [unclassified Halorhodospira]|uniref:type I-G CRISPR-associated protein Cas8g1/Csx17 n=1 Tax=unclassified Halorhodospira TaxID=2626748 RepID=UPI001EE85BEA|nr:MULTISPECIES: type I-U CRISPR-associated protein Csx17 [unclassified Halorhodospira]MCG5540854.1 type I-U CRISPR-associated protein Csx17 [Halorhodospira sp. M39old]MCG5546094.1 type I-U CRISPR-associated protein Csx17 [Halorhodospira sp. M38]
MVEEPAPDYQAADAYHATPLPGCTPVPLASYLKALGILRLVVEQADPEARGCWQNEQFVLESRLDAEELKRFFLEEYRPTPILAPWNGGSGFYPKDNQDGIEPLSNASAQRLDPLRATITGVQGILKAHGYQERPAGDDKAALLAELRAELPEAALAWLDAAVLLTEDSPHYPPLLGTGGNDGRLDFTNNFMQRLVALLDPETGQARPEAVGWLDEALFDRAGPGLPTAKVGQFSPGEAGGPNQTAGFDIDKPLVNPWDFTLMLEGALLFAATATRRLEGSTPGALSYPFTVRATGAGSGGAALGDEDNARAEFWAPLWSAPVGLAELQGVLAEGRVTLGRRPARDGLDFVRAVSHLGVERGLEGFQRYAFLMRSGKAYFATPLNRVTVQRNPAADLIDELDAGGWLDRFRRHARGDGANRMASLARRLEDAVFELATRRDDTAPAVRRLLAVLGAIQLHLARSPKAREACPPVPALSAQWLTRADDGSPELALAAALAGLHGRDGKAGERMPMRAHLAPETASRYPSWAADDTHTVTWAVGASLADNLAATLHRRLLEAHQGELADKPLRGSRTAPLADVAAWLSGDLDEQRLAELLLGLMLVRIPPGPPRAQREAPLPAAYRLLKPLFCTDEQLRRAGVLPPDRALPLKADLLRRLEAHDVAGALELGRRRRRAAGIGTGFQQVAPGIADGRRLLAALMVPISDAALKALAPGSVTEPAAAETNENH